jgi:hypothetical protein
MENIEPARPLKMCVLAAVEPDSAVLPPHHIDSFSMPDWSGFAGHFDHIAAPFAFRAIEVDVRPTSTARFTASAEILHLADVEPAEDWNPFDPHEGVIRCRALEIAKAGVSFHQGSSSRVF